MAKEKLCNGDFMKNHRELELTLTTATNEKIKKKNFDELVNETCTVVETQT